MATTKSKTFVISAVVILSAIIGYFLIFQDDAEDIFLGTWNAKWRTPPEAFEGIDAFTSFEMEGVFIFTEDRATVIANGFPGCVFGMDTLSHTQGWQVSEKLDTLHLVSEGGMIGITYKINGLSEQYIELQLLDDIFISLEKTTD